MKMYFVVTYRGGLFDRLARRFGLTWTHAAILFEDGLVFESTWYKIRAIKFRKFLEGVREYQVYKLKDDPESYKPALDYCWGSVGKIYNFWWLLRIIMKLLVRHPQTLRYTSHICSSFVADVYDYIGCPIVGGDIAWVLPDDLAASEKVELWLSNLED